MVVTVMVVMVVSEAEANEGHRVAIVTIAPIMAVPPVMAVPAVSG
jgi:hypothetical protein